MDFELVFLEAEEKMEDVLNQYKVNLSKISTGRANPQILELVKVDYYGTLTPIPQLANISVPEPRQLLIKPYDMSVNKDIVSAINKASLGINAVDEGDKTRIKFPELTTERRRELVKSLSTYTEQARVQIRGVRQDANKDIKAAENLPEDDEKRFLEDIQKLTDKFNAQIEEATEVKQRELMTI